MTMYGADADALDALATNMSGSSEYLENIAVGLHNRIQGTAWFGEEAEMFGADWSHRHLPQLLQASDFLGGLGAVVHDNAAEQRYAAGLSPAMAASVGEISRFFSTDEGPLDGGEELAEDTGGAAVEEAVGKGIDNPKVVRKTALRGGRIVYRGVQSIRGLNAVKTSALVVRPSAEVTSHIASTVLKNYKVIAAETARVTKFAKFVKYAKFAGPLFSAATGLVAVIDGANTLSDKKATDTQRAAATLDVISGSLGMVAGVAAGVALVCPVLAPVALGVAAVAGGLSAVTGIAAMVVEHHEFIGTQIVNAATAVERAAKSAATDIANAITAPLSGIGGLFSW